ncbi:hypothetical protein I317_07818 [Kwoniella heveanensis CBS 569]|uniref:Family A G protein-coupled receptor-like protein n=1 Tax=Kwoniella heveanensis BCC8398 TaxID=1296120 RepID=A0A1B9GS83_9TREE|nr:hypothetical protein I316_04277 [Kwoniella heveanensis BCC8398]OCF38404.1 hypothetical protein I317_07818 [Kwoniella heveanensis CBS 569]
MANDAINVNPPNGAVQHITSHGSDWLWAVFAIMTVSDIIVFFWQFRLPRGQRVFHQLAMFILTTAAIAYFAMASDLGFTPVATEFGHMGYAAGTARQLWYVRYIDWVITTPSLLLTLVLASGLPLSDIIALCYFDIVMIVTGLVGGLVPSVYKWGFYAFGCAALFYIWWVLAGPARSSAGVIGPKFQSAFTLSAAILSFLWLLYPIAWGLADGGNVISPDSEMVFYGVLDVLAKPVFTFIHLWKLSSLDLTLLQLSSGKFTTSAGVYDREKHAASAVTATTAGAGAAAPTKTGGLFARRGQRDAEPRMSEQTAVNA